MSQPLNEQQFKQLLAFAFADFEIFLAEFEEKWLVERGLIAQLCRCDIRTVSRWKRWGRNIELNRASKQWYLTIADILLSHFEELPEDLQSRLCPNWTSM